MEFEANTVGEEALALLTRLRSVAAVTDPVTWLRERVEAGEIDPEVGWLARGMVLTDSDLA